MSVDDGPPPGWHPHPPDLEATRLDYEAAFLEYVTSWPGDPDHAKLAHRYVRAFERLARARGWPPP